MTDQTSAKKTANRKTYVPGIVLILLIGSALIWPEHAKDTTLFVFWSLIEISPIVIPGILLSAWIIASGADSRISGAFEGRTLQSVLTAALIGSITPVCGVTVLPLMAGLLTAGVPLAPIMAFWLSSPVTDPAMLATTIATLGLPFALGKTLAAFGSGCIWRGRHNPLCPKKLGPKGAAEQCPVSKTELFGMQQTTILRMGRGPIISDSKKGVKNGPLTRRKLAFIGF